jgi:hypothetical protein
MESLTHLVSESFARHGFDRPLDYRRLHWSRWFPCDSPRSLLIVPSRPGVFALAEEMAELRGKKNMWDRVADPVMPSAARLEEGAAPDPYQGTASVVSSGARTIKAALAAVGISDEHGGAAATRRMLAVLQFCEDDDMAFVLDRMFSRQNPMRSRLNSGRCFVRFVVLEDQSQRRSICNALNQWLISSSEVATGIGAHFASSLEITDPGVARDKGVGRTFMSASARHAAQSELDLKTDPDPSSVVQPSSTLDSGAAANMHYPSPFPSGF